jgi:hypothetical protein
MQKERRGPMQPAGTSWMDRKRGCQAATEIGSLVPNNADQQSVYGVQSVEMALEIFIINLERTDIKSVIVEF